MLPRTTEADTHLPLTPTAVQGLRIPRPAPETHPFMTHNRFAPRLVRSYTTLRLYTALAAQRKALSQGDPKGIARTRAELMDAAQAARPIDRRMVRRLAVA